MALTGLDDPGLTVFPTHRLLSGFADDPERQRAPRRRACVSSSRSRRSRRDRVDPLGEDGVGVFGLYDSFHKQAFRLRLKDTAELDRRLEGKPEAYRRLDAAILETLVLKGLAGMSEDDIAAKRGIDYAKSVEDALRAGRRRAPTTSPSSCARSRSSRSRRSPKPTRTCRRSRPTSSPR